jgi:hypothetical protein
MKRPAAAVLGRVAKRPASGWSMADVMLGRELWKVLLDRPKNRGG